MISTFSKLGGILAGIFSVTTIINFSKEASNLAIEQEASVQRLIDIYGVASKEVGDFIDLNARALGMSKASAVSFSAVYGNLFSVWADQATNAELTNQYLNMTAVIASKTGRTVADVQERIRSGLLGNTEAIEDLGVFVNVKTIEITEAFQRIANGRSWEQLTAYEQSQVRTLAILEQSTLKYGNQVADTNALARAQYLASYQELQVTWGQFVNTVLLPVLRVVTEIMDILTEGLRTIANLTGQTADNTYQSASNIESGVENQENLTNAVKETNKELNKSLAKFDELNTISSSSGAGGLSYGGAGGSNNGLGGLFRETTQEDMVKKIEGLILPIMGVVAFGLVAIGLILVETGNVAWGVGFIIAGAVGLGVTMATISSDGVSQKTRDALSNALIIVGIVAIIIGILCCVAKQWKVGIGLIVLGATTIAPAIALNWDSIKEKLQGLFGGILAIVGIVAIVLGVLCCTAHHWSIGIGLIVTGALAVGTVVAVNWEAIKTALKGPLGTALAIVGVVAVVLGILCCVAGHWVLGISYIVAGGLLVGTEAVLNWDTIRAKLEETWVSITTWWDNNVAKYFTAEWWLEKGKEMVSGLLGPFRGITKSDLGGGLGGGVVKLPGLAGKIPGLARGAVLPPNKPFLSIVGDQRSGTNVEAPLDTIVQAMKIALNGSGGFNGRIEVPVYIGNRQVALAVREAENEMGSQTVVGGFANAY
jgi:hypothetical protein